MSICGDLAARIHSEAYAAGSDRLPDSLLHLIFNKIGDVKSLGRCCLVSRRFHSLVAQVENVVVRVDCVISDDDSSSTSSASDNTCSPIASLFRAVFSNVAKALQALGQLFGPKRTSSSSFSPSPAIVADFGNVMPYDLAESWLAKDYDLALQISDVKEELSFEPIESVKDVVSLPKLAPRCNSRFEKR